MDLNVLTEMGQSIWLDFIRRSFTASGGLQRLVDQGVRGVTSNPSIFEKAIAGSDDYDGDMRRLVREGRSVDGIYEALALEDIVRAADILRPVYEESGCADGYVSLEVSPTLAHDTEKTITEARRLFGALDRPNIMIKVPATPAGIPAIETLIGEGINVNATLIFSLAHYEAVARAYIAGLEKLEATGPAGALGRVASVASFFVSRIDTAVDRALNEVGETELAGKIAIASARAAYGRFREIFCGERWERLVAQGARVQRPLWASTSTKNPLYPDTLYVDNLIGPETVNTLPPDTLEAFLDHGRVSAGLEAGIEEAGRQLGRLSAVGIDLEAITEKLQEEGVAAFAKAFDGLMASIAGKREQLLAEERFLTVRPGRYQDVVDRTRADVERRQIVERIWAHDYTVWKPEPTEITNRLGWLRIAETMGANLDRLEALTASIRADGYTDVLLLGMGGSSLAPQVFRQTFGLAEGHPDLAALDSTDPGAVLAHAERLEPDRTLLVVATKSGRTVETLSFFKYFYNWAAKALGQDRAGRHFVAITDPGSDLDELASRLRFRETFLNDPTIGGRYSALSYFGLAAAALVGLDVRLLLDRALSMGESCGSGGPPAAGDNPGLRLGVVLGELAKAGRDKVTLITSAAIGSFGDWVEQLVAESTGKEGRGILPVVGEPPARPAEYGDDRLFVYLRLNGDQTYDAAVQALEEAGHPVVRVQLRDLYDLGGQFFLWEFATGVAGSLLGINPFSQPNVEAAKVLARRMVTEYEASGALPEQKSILPDPGAVTAFLDQAQPGAYIALQAYVQPTAETDEALLALRTRLRDRYRLATTVGYGPRFLHSTGQLHKGDSGRGLFIQFTSDSLTDAPIPDEVGSPESNTSFGVLKMAQAQGDYQALVNVGRRVLRIHLGMDVVGELMKLAEGLA